jgi:hypothetical protein
MTSNEFKKVGRLLKEIYSDLEKEAIGDGIDIFSDEYKQIQDRARQALLDKMGFTLDEYRAAKELVAPAKKVDIQPQIDALKQAQEAHSNVYIPTTEDITKIAEDVARTHIKAPQIVNQIVKETTVEKPQIIKETTVEKTVEIVNYNEKPLQEKIGALSRRIDELNIPVVPPPINVDKLKLELSNEFSANLAYNIDILGMPNFRKLAMGLRQDLDALQEQVNSLPAGGSGWTIETPTGSLYDQDTASGGTSFTSSDTAVAVFADGATYFNGCGCIISGTSITMDNPVTQFIRIAI